MMDLSLLDVWIEPPKRAFRVIWRLTVLASRGARYQIVQTREDSIAANDQ